MVPLRSVISGSVVALVVLLGPTAQARSARICKADSAPLMRASAACQYGLPVRVGRALLVAKACRIPMAEGAVSRHAVEIRDAATGKRLGQASLPATKASPDGEVPKVGTLLGGAFPLYVFAGGIGAIDHAARRAELVFEPTGRLMALARAGEVLAVIDALPADATFPNGSLEWTVLDFGKGEMLGQARLAGSDVDGTALAQRGDGLHALLDVTGKKGPLTLAAHLRDKKGKQITSSGLLRPKVETRRKPGTSPAAKVAGATCPVVNVGDAVRTTQPVLVVDGAGAGPAAAAIQGWLTIATTATCLAASAVGADGVAWAWLRAGKRTGLHRLACARGAADPVKSK